MHKRVFYYFREGTKESFTSVLKSTNFLVKKKKKKLLTGKTIERLTIFQYLTKRLIKIIKQNTKKKDKRFTW